jgi:NADH-quinone oxidoreductase subunit C
MSQSTSPKIRNQSWQNMTNAEILNRLKERFPESVRESVEFREELTILLRSEDLVRVAEFLKSESALAFDLIVDICGVDRYQGDERFEVVYHVYSLRNRRYLRLKVRAGEENPVVPTVTGVWPGANWHEREAWDMFGIRFAGHPDLRRLYMPEEFEYHPLRKDFPLMGIPDSLPLPRH